MLNYENQAFWLQLQDVSDKSLVEQEVHKNGFQEELHPAAQRFSNECQHPSINSLKKTTHVGKRLNMFSWY